MPRTALKRLFLLFAFRCSAPAVLLFALPAVAQNQSSKKHVAVLNFDSPSVSPGGSSGLFGADASEVGKGVSAQLIVRLLAYGKYSVLDRDALQKILKEQKQADTTGLDAYALACKVGRIANLDALIIGAVTRYGPDDLRVPSASGMHTRKSKAFVEITARVFNVSSGEILAQFLGSGESSDSGVITIISNHKTKSSTQMLGSEFVNALLPEATALAIQQLAVQLNGFADKIPTLRPAVDGLVAEVSGTTVTLNLTKRSGIQPGDQLEISRDRLPSDPSSPPQAATGPVRVAIATVTEVTDDYSIATFSGSTAPRVGDHVHAFADSHLSPH
jgi:curli biogenesis system outer membrane secretion channel CsgG